MVHAAPIAKFVAAKEASPAEQHLFFLAEAPPKTIGGAVTSSTVSALTTKPSREEDTTASEQVTPEDDDSRFAWVRFGEARSMLNEREDRNLLFLARRYLEEAVLSGVLDAPHWTEVRKQLQEQDKEEEDHHGHSHTLSVATESATSASSGDTQPSLLPVTVSVNVFFFVFHSIFLVIVKYLTLLSCSINRSCRAS